LVGVYPANGGTNQLAAKSYQTALAGGATHGEIMAGAQRYADSNPASPLWLANWLKFEKWKEHPKPPAPRRSSGNGRNKSWLGAATNMLGGSSDE
jgi:hypothetical protein